MTAPDPSIADHEDRNDADLRYLEGARVALRLAMATSEAVLGSATAGDDVRALARDALAEQERQLGDILDCLDQGATAAPTTPQAGDGRARPAGDQELADRLSVHALASIRAARREMIAGVSPQVRAIAEQSIRTGSRYLAALDHAPVDPTPSAHRRGPSPT